MYEYELLKPEHAASWRLLRIEGVRAFPLGFLLTVEEAAKISEDQARQVLSQGDMRGVFQDHNLVGFCGFRRPALQQISHRAEIGPFYVTPDHQGSGAAKTLMDGVIAEAREAGVALLELYVDEENPRALSFYRKHGFSRVASIPDMTRIDGKMRIDLLLRRDLTET